MSPTINARSALASRFLVVAALLIFFWLAVSTALDKSPTNDEPIHMTRGAVLHQSRDFSLQVGHMPLSHWLIGALFSTEPDLPRIHDLASWQTGDRLDMADEFLWHSGVDVDRLSFLGRMPIIWSGLILGALLALWTTAVAGQTAAKTGGGDRATLAALGVVMTLYAFSSNLLASASLATTDFVTTVTYFATVCAWWFYWQRPQWKLWLATGVLLGAVLGSKLTGFLLVPVLLPLAYVYPGKRRNWWRPALIWLGLLPVMALSLWAIYAFTVGEWAGLTLPAPAYWEAWQSVLTHVESGHQAFLMGQLSEKGWWIYFPVSFLIKTPVVWLGLIGVALVLLVRRRISWQVAAFTLLPSAALFAAAITSRLNIGYRHILPMIPFLLVLIGHVLPALWPQRMARWVVGIGVALTALVALWIHPNHIAAFNLAVGGPTQGYRYLGDSNLDWGQDLRALAELVTTAETPVFWSFAGSADPAYYGLTPPSPLSGADGLGDPTFSPANPAPGRYAISATHIQGILAESDLFDWFRRRSPDSSLGYSILIYDVDETTPGVWIAQCANPVPALAPEAAEQLLGVTGVRHMSVDCEQTEVTPVGEPGWTIVPGLENGDDVVYRHASSSLAPAYTVRYATGNVTSESLQTHATMTSGAVLDLPQAVGDAAELIGYQVEGNRWLTYWRVTAVPDAPLSIQAHLLDAGGTVLSVADGLGFSSDQWQPGDLLVQRFDFGDATGGVALETGLYNYVTLESLGSPLRLPVPTQ
ncbi:MAG: glycosyltransferase family 39 protein [Chloroflexota bacterium]